MVKIKEVNVRKSILHHQLIHLLHPFCFGVYHGRRSTAFEKLMEKFKAFTVVGGAFILILIKTKDYSQDGD